MKLTLILFCLFTFLVFSQEIKINGIVTGENNEPLSNILITVLTINKTTISYQYTNGNGEFAFVLEVDDRPEFLKMSSLFYEENEVQLSDDMETVFVLKPRLTELDEVVIASKRINNDTINLGIHNYNINKTESVENTLKKIPGISVDQDGRIKYWNKEIEKILIDGDDLANNQYTFISKNLRSEVIEDIQVLKNFEENTVLKKTRNSDKIALNLKIKEKFKNIWFGNVSVGYGTGTNNNNEFKGDSNLGLLKKKIKFLNSLKYSTLGDKAIPVLFGDNRYEIDNVPIYSIEKINVPLVDEMTNFNSGFTNTFLINKKIKNVTLRSTNFIGIDNQKQELLRETDFFLQGDSLIESTRNRDRNLMLFGELDLKYDGLENNYFSNKFKYKIQSNKFSSFSLYDVNVTSDLGKNEEVAFYNHFQHTFSFNNGIILNSEFNFGISNLDENIAIDSEDLNSFFNNDSEIRQQVDKHLSYFGVKTDATYFINRKLKSNLSFQFKNSEEHFDILLFPEDVLYKNDEIFYRNELIVEPSLIYRISKRINLKTIFGSNFFNINKVNRTLINYNTILNLKFWGDIEISFSKKQDLISNQNFLQNYYLADNNTFRRGGHFLTPLNYEQLKFTLNNKNEKSTFNNEFSFTYRNSKPELLEDFSLLNNLYFNNTLLIFKTREDFVFKDQLIFLIDNLGFKAETSQSYALIPLNDQNVESTEIYDSNYVFEVTSYFSSAFNFNLKLWYHKNVQFYDGNKSSFDSKNIVLNFDWNMNKEIALNLNGGAYKLNGNLYKIFNTSINYVPENKSFSYGLKMNNLLNEDQFLYQSRNSFFTSKTTIPLIPFYVFASIKYIF